MPSTGRASRALKNSSGIENEKFFSRTFHTEGYALLISPHVLRSRELGQIDLGRIKKDQHGWLVEIGEVKSSLLGKQMMARYQIKRLMAAQNFLGSLFGHRTKLISLSRAD